MTAQVPYNMLTRFSQPPCTSARLVNDYCRFIYRGLAMAFTTATAAGPVWPNTDDPRATVRSSSRQIDGPSMPSRIVLVMQGGGAPGCYQAGAYQALHDSGMEPDWVIGTSIGAINGAIIAGKRYQIASTS